MKDLKKRAKSALKREALRKGAKGDWKKENYTLHHSDMGDTSKEHGHHLVVAKKNGKEVGHLRYFNQEVFGAKKRELYTGMVHVDSRHQRKGLATAMHQAAEKRHDLKFAESTEQTASGKKLYGQKNRPFGKSELGKSAKGDWKSEGYTIHHEEAKQDTHERHFGVYAHDKHGKRVGEAHYANIKGNGLYVSGLKVHPDHRRKGLASALHSYAEKHAGQKITSEPQFQSTQAKKLWSQKNRPFGQK